MVHLAYEYGVTRGHFPRLQAVVAVKEKGKTHMIPGDNAGLWAGASKAGSCSLPSALIFDNLNDCYVYALCRTSMDVFRSLNRLERVGSIMAL
jgi:hypothetical protein